MINYLVSKKNKILNGTIHLDGSKSISNRVLLIQALCDKSFTINNLSTSDDTKAMQAALQNTSKTINVGAAGTTMRFLTAYLATQQGEWILTGSERMKKRPIKILVDTLNKLGADIQYLENDGFPPLKINGRPLKAKSITIKANVSSQYISALLLIAPTLPNGLELRLEGELVSRPYIEMTLNIMKYFGVAYSWENDLISVSPQPYQAKDFMVEADWSAASYFYAISAFSEAVNLTLEGLFEDSLQGDRMIADIMKDLGIQTHFINNKIILSKKNRTIKQFNYDFITCPDIAQTLVVICAGLGIKASFSGLQTLAIKETDRTAALAQELSKFQILFQNAKNIDTHTWQLDFLAAQNDTSNSKLIRIETYKDHRMAMAFATFAVLQKNGIIIEDAAVVSKSYPNFWKDLASLGFTIEAV